MNNPTITSLKHRSSPTPSTALPLLSLRRHRNALSAALLLMALALLIASNKGDHEVYHAGSLRQRDVSFKGANSLGNSEMARESRHDSVYGVDDDVEEPMEDDAVPSNFDSSDGPSTESENDEKYSLVASEDATQEDNKHDENNSENENHHPWWWIGMIDTLSNQNVDVTTSALANYANDKTSYSTPDEFLKACHANQLPDKQCDFVGGPENKFSAMPAHVMMVLRHLGMKTTSRVLEVGVGLGRNAKSIIDFLDKGGFCGIEPNGDMLAVGVAHMIGKDVMKTKQPRFSTDSDFDFGVFFQKEKEDKSKMQLFDVVTSRSAWTHTSKLQIEKYLASFARYTNPDAFLATSVVDVTEDCSKDYNGTEWVGKSHDDNNLGVVVHCMPWLREACRREGLVVKSLVEECPELVNDKWSDLGQPWIVVRHHREHA
ncbi:hypothetical protein HJC23_000740 [Cyclotella cryptica]|uniref:Methyltransferase domain-containing protein n=1 Tax=Cyclotella cryptica TaxID=29204 RepID=A0ABD3NMZ3_9STRA|eukprot:CCRYP_020758-RA/>CCRYP_020758-RA protein AED:0.06 eAED:0.06 QI:147/1/1/1/1/1/2/171/430